jgi:hypothetical protein
MTKEDKAIRTWKLLIHAGREEMNLTEFAAKVNDYTGSDYEPRELRVIFEQLHREPEKLFPPQK